jgi:hypothetical protein
MARLSQTDPESLLDGVREQVIAGIQMRTPREELQWQREQRYRQDVTITVLLRT